MISVFHNRIIREDMQNIDARDIDLECLKNSTVMVTGAYGMLASYLVYYLCWMNETQDMNIRIIAQGRSRDKMQNRFAELCGKSYLIEAYEDILKPFVIEGKIDYIVHAAGLSRPDAYAVSPVEVSEANALGTYYLLQLAREKKVKAFLFFSSGDIYGKMKDTENVSENVMGIMDPLDGHSCYGESKRMAETWCASFCREYGVPVRIARIGHTYGPTMDIQNDSRVFASFMRCLIHKADIVMMSDGTARRPFCYIADAVAAYLLLLSKGQDGEAYNVCNSQEFLSIRELADMLAGLRPQWNIKVTAVQRCSGDAYMECRANKQNMLMEDKMKNLGWQCSYPAKKGFEQVLDYFTKENMI